MVVFTKIMGVYADKMFNSHLLKLKDMVIKLLQKTKLNNNTK